MDEAFKQLFDKSEITFDLSSEDSINKAMIEYAYFFWNAAWLESARRADKRAREECERIALQYSQAYGQIDDAMAIARDIRATIKEVQT